MPEIFDPHYSSRSHQTHIEERVAERMRDTSELDNLKADVRDSRGKRVEMPWRVGRPLRSTGVTQTSGPDEGCPQTPLALLNLEEAMTDSEKRGLVRELDRVVVQDMVAEGTLDHASELGLELVAEETWWEAEARQERELAETQLKENQDGQQKG